MTCLGCETIQGQFSGSVSEGSYQYLGAIPEGKKDLKIMITAKEDLDIQLYESGACSSDPSQGQAIIGYSEVAGCGSTS